MSLIGSVALVAAVFAFGEWLRAGVAEYPFDEAVKTVILDVVLSVEFCAASFEGGVIFDNAGRLWWIVVVFACVVYYSLRWKSYIFPSPGAHLVQYLNGGCGFRELIFRSGTVLASGIYSSRLISFIWEMEFSAFHLNRKSKLDNCSDPWSEVPVISSAAAEAFGTFTLAVTNAVIAVSDTDPIGGALLFASVAVLVILVALDFSGGMLNPMLATVMLNRCDGFSWQRHLFVYWIGGLSGSLLAHLLCSTVKAIDIMLYLSGLRLKVLFQTTWRHIFTSLTALAQPFIILRILMKDLATFFAQLARPFLVLRGLMRHKS